MGFISKIQNKGEEVWKPIETAPRDGTIVDLFHKTAGRIVDSWWDDDCWVTTLEGDEAYSHWMLPPCNPDWEHIHKEPIDDL